MKKFLALLMAALMLLSMTAAFAEGESTTPSSFTKRYTGALPVGDTLTFNVEFLADYSDPATNPNALPATITHTVVAADGLINTVEFNVTTPAEYGVYYYAITEQADDTNNVTEDTDTLYLAVQYTNANGLVLTLVNEPTQNDDSASNGDTQQANLEGESRAEDVAPPEKPDGKKDQFVNEYATGKVTVTKEITGNASVATDTFQVSVVLESTIPLDTSAIKWNDAAVTIVAAEDNSADNGYTYSLYASADANLTITEGSYILTGVAVGTTVTVEEIEADLKGYTPTYTAGKTVTVDATEDGQTIAITNNKEVDIPTGVVMDYIPYVILLVVAVAGLASFVLKRRMAADNDD